MKNIVVCCDGTRGKYEAEDKNTNVVRLFERLGKDGADQISYYDPGVGTYSPLRIGPGRWVAKVGRIRLWRGDNWCGAQGQHRRSLQIPHGLLRT